MELFSLESVESYYHSYLDKSKEYKQSIFHNMSVICTLNKAMKDNLRMIGSINIHIHNLQSSYTLHQRTEESFLLFQNRIQGLKNTILILDRENSLNKQRILNLDNENINLRTQFYLNERYITILEELVEKQKVKPAKKRVRFN